MKKKLPKFIKSVKYEYVCDNEYVEFKIIFDKKLFNELDIESQYETYHNYKYKNTYIVNKLGKFYENEDSTCWFWTLVKEPIIPYEDKERKELGDFYLMDGIALNYIDETPYFENLKKELIPFLEEEMRKALDEYY